VSHHKGLFGINHPFLCPQSVLEIFEPFLGSKRFGVAWGNQFAFFECLFKIMHELAPENLGKWLCAKKKAFPGGYPLGGCPRIEVSRF
jgi:hypothetical protein